MQRFSPGDSILILPRFSPLYPSSTATVVSVSPNAFRSMFNEYEVQFHSGARDNLFEFQLLENNVNYQNFLAMLTFDSSKQPSAGQLRGPLSERQLLLQTEFLSIDMKVTVAKTQASFLGQILSRDQAESWHGAEVTIMQDSNPLRISVADHLGIFKLQGIPVGPLNLQVLVRRKMLRVMGAFSIVP